MYAAYFGLVQISPEDEIVHVGDGGNGCSVIEGVAHDNGVADLDRHVQNQSGNSGSNQCAAERSTVFGDAFLHDFQIIFGCLQLFACLFHANFTLFVFFIADELVIE